MTKFVPITLAKIHEVRYVFKKKRDESERRSPEGWSEREEGREEIVVVDFTCRIPGCDGVGPRYWRADRKIDPSGNHFRFVRRTERLVAFSHRVTFVPFSFFFSSLRILILAILSPFSFFSRTHRKLFWKYENVRVEIRYRGY